ncbi:MAG TPA: hypothetical protein PLC98_14245 [Anaerolineales bacterium]|nr:hypothetical protein [Anaerolineales bacterium]
MRNRTPMVEILIGSLAGLTSAALAVGVFFLSSDFLMMFAATPCILGLAGILAGFLAGRPVHGSGLRGGVVAGAVAALVSGAAAALATLLFSLAGFLGGGFEQESAALFGAIGAVCGGGLVASLIGLGFSALGGWLGGMFAGKR